MAATKGIALLLYTILYLVESFFKTCVDLFVPDSLRRRKDVTGEIVLVTGGGNGLGRHLAIRFAKLNAIVVIWDINEVGNEETARIIREFGGVVHAYTVDISKPDNVYTTADRVRHEVGDVTILVNNAGIMHYKPPLECPDDVIQKTLSVNAISHFWLHKAFVPTMKARNSGHIITISSIMAYMAFRGFGAYMSSKYAVIGIHESLQLDLAFENSDIKMTLVCPSGLATNMILGRVNTGDAVLYQPSDAAEQIVEGVLTEKPVVCVPRGAYVYTIVKNLIPTKLMVMLLRSVNLEKTFIENGGTDTGATDDTNE